MGWELGHGTWAQCAREGHWRLFCGWFVYVASMAKRLGSRVSREWGCLAMASFPRSSRGYEERERVAGGNRREIKTAQPLDESYLGRFPALSTSMDQPCCKDKLSSLLEVKSSNNSSQLEDILPANLSCFTPCMDMKKLNRSSELMINKKKLSITGRGKMQYQNHDVIDLSGDVSLDRQQSKEKQLVTCSIKKRKVLLIEHDTLLHDKTSDHYASDAQRNVLNAKAHLLHKDDGAAEVDAKFLNQKSESVHLSAEPRGAKETKGSAFLVQVKEKLRPAEYKEFLGFMRAMKSNVMEIGNVLQSIVGLFSGPGRLPLLERYTSTLNWLSP
ncbi:hypothetical protein REPUB_Repub13aG0177200 [Reevesia pubescens]